MKERPILFSGPMVRALLDGRKGQTRRIVKRGQVYRFDASGDLSREERLEINAEPFDRDLANPAHPTIDELLTCCPYGSPGDRLVVKEAAWMWCERRPNGTTKTGRAKWRYVPLQAAPVHYCAEHPDRPSIAVVSPDTGNEWGWRRKIGRFLPRWASRISLEVTGVRVERLQSMSFNDWRDDFAPGHAEQEKALASFTGARYQQEHAQQLWDSINAKRAPWASNPWVWVVEFSRVGAQELAA